MAITGITFDAASYKYGDSVSIALTDTGEPDKILVYFDTSTRWAFQLAKSGSAYTLTLPCVDIGIADDIDAVFVASDGQVVTETDAFTVSEPDNVEDPVVDKLLDFIRNDVTLAAYFKAYYAHFKEHREFTTTRPCVVAYSSGGTPADSGVGRLDVEEMHDVTVLFLEDARVLGASAQGIDMHKTARRKLVDYVNVNYRLDSMSGLEHIRTVSWDHPTQIGKSLYMFQTEIRFKFRALRDYS